MTSVAFEQVWRQLLHALHPVMKSGVGPLPAASRPCSLKLSTSIEAVSQSCGRQPRLHGETAGAISRKSVRSGKTTATAASTGGQ